MKKLIISLLLLSACTTEQPKEKVEPKDTYMDSITHYADSIKWDLYDFQDSIKQVEVERIIKEKQDALSN